MGETWTAELGRQSWGGELPPSIKFEGRTIAVVQDHLHIYANDDVDQEAMAKRDAKRAIVMAAANDLLASCKEMLEQNYMPGSSMLIAQRAAAAIAKAERESP